MRATAARFTSVHSPQALPFSQSDVSVDPYFYCRLRYVEDLFHVPVFSAVSHYFRVIFPRQPSKLIPYSETPGTLLKFCMPITNITVRGARQHNLQDIHVQIPRNTLYRDHRPLRLR